MLAIMVVGNLFAIKHSHAELLMNATQKMTRKYGVWIVTTRQ